MTNPDDPPRADTRSAPRDAAEPARRTGYFIATGALVHWLAGYGSCFVLTSANMNPLPVWLLAIAIGALLSLIGLIRAWRRGTGLRIAACLNFGLIVLADGFLLWLLVAFTMSPHH